MHVTPTPECCMTVAEAAQYLRLGRDKVRELIRLGRLQAIDIGLGGVGRQQLRIEPEALAEFKAGLRVGKPAPRRKRADDLDPEIIAMLGR